MEPFLFVNPLASSYSQTRVNMVVDRLEAAGLAPTVFSATTPHEISSYCRQISATATAPLIIIAGGDGTINAVLNGLEPGTSTIAVLPMGTSNVLAIELGIPSLEHGLERIIQGETKPLSLGVLELEHRSFRFVLMAGIGLDGAVVRDVWPRGKRLLKQGAYAVSAFFSLFRWDSSKVRVAHAGEVLECHSVIVCNASRYGGDCIIAPGEDLSTPQLTAVCICKNTRRAYLRLVFNLLMKSAGYRKRFVSITADRLEICGVKPIQIDGDFVGYSPARITTLPDFARIIV